MKKLLLPVVGIAMAASAIAAPTAEVPVSDLLGLRAGSGAGGDVFASYGQPTGGNHSAAMAKVLKTNWGGGSNL